nr:TetR/AcrR family transcriptional regulator [Ornithinimicrobium sp. HY1793]
MLIRDSHGSASAGGGTKERVLLEAVELIAINGYQTTSMRQIAERAGIRAASIYNHFPSKDALVVSALQWIFDDFVAFIAEPMTRHEPAVRTLETLVRRHALYQFQFPHRMDSWRIILETDQLAAVVPDQARSAVQVKRDLLIDLCEALTRAAYPTLQQPRERVRAVNTLCGRASWWFDGDLNDLPAMTDLIWSLAVSIFTSPLAQEP